MTGKRTKTWIAGEKPLVEVRRRSVKMLGSQRIGVSWGLSGRCIGRVDGQTR